MTAGKTIVLTRGTFVGEVMSLLFHMLSRLVIAFLPRSKHLLILWLHSPSAVTLEAKKIKLVTVCIVSSSICHEVMGPDAMILVFFECWVLSQLFYSPLSILSIGFLVPLHFKSPQSFPTLCTLWTVARQAPLSLRSSKQEYWSRLPCPPPENLPSPWTKPTSPEPPALQVIPYHWDIRGS